MLGIVNADIHPVSGPRFHGHLLMDQGRIVALGPDLTIPEGVECLDADGRPVTPGIVEAHAHLGLLEQGLGVEGSDGNERSDPWTPQMRALDGINPLDDGFREFREAGITTALIPPGSANILGGVAVVIKCHGSVVDDMVLLPHAGIKAALGENPKRVYGEGEGRAPATRMGSAALLRQALDEARTYWDKRKGQTDGPEYDARWEALQPVLEREVPLRIHCHRADDIVTALRIAQEYNIHITLEHVTEGDHVLDLLEKHQVPCAIGPTLFTGSKVESRERDFRTPVLVSRRSIPFCLTTDHPVVAGQYLPLTAGIAVSWGMEYEAALRSITLSAAEHAGVADRVGSLEVGKDADVVIWSGDPLDYTTFAEVTLIDGQIVYERGRWE